VASASNAAETAEQALAVALEQVCEHTGWPVGHVYLRKDDRLVSSGQWRPADDPHWSALRAASDSISFTEGLGLPGRVAASGAPAWIRDIREDDAFTRREVAAAAGVRAAFAFPMPASDGICGVLEFFTTEVAEPDEALLSVMTDVGVMLGRVLERTETQAALQALNAELRRSNRELEEFAYIASHDLSEPLRMITSYLQLIERRYKDRLDQDGVDFINFAVDGGQRMQRLIQDLLEYSRAGRARIDTQDVAMATVVDELRHFFGERGTIEADELPVVRADPAQLTRVFQNLVGNGLKFAREGVPPTVTIAARPEGDGWLFTVRDNGIGVPEDQFERAFRMFGRLHARDQYEGTGIGLPICRRIVERHGGRIGFRAVEGEGACVELWLPAEPVIPPAAEAAPAA
jgi:signal transduction histidine kinase